ncbi:hypothetical protein [Acetobacter cibinongensis]|uniref:Uncharacterized protein n=1 Tax=Acetobacter cibinongensis TaxID=146475 RepID=A0A1Z5YWN1_9PROT|nr:hypothetical protein [Acetobacter cibinongensis]OUJ03600.1 hypothetical protein HK14_01330 [Acetobacter cibinongensis]
MTEGAQVWAHDPHVQNSGVAAYRLGVSAQTFQRLASCVYTRDLLYGCVREKLGGELPDALTEAQQYLLMQDSEALGVLALRLGCACYARPVLSLLSGDALRKLAALTTPHVMQDAAWGLPFSDVTDGPDTPEKLAGLIQGAGLACLRGWCNQQPAAVGLRVLSFLPEQKGKGSFSLENPESMVEAFIAERLRNG